MVGRSTCTVELVRILNTLDLMKSDSYCQGWELGCVFSSSWEAAAGARLCDESQYTSSRTTAIFFSFNSVHVGITL
jgi:hypothetical protein